jgi:hypothetical protein
MRALSPLRLGLASLAVASLGILVAAAPAGAREFELRGHSTESGCNQDVPVKLTVVVHHGDLAYIEGFQAKGYGYSNETPPVPEGHPAGHCYPAPEGWRVWSFKDPDGGITTRAKFGTGDLRPNQFEGTYKNKYHGATLYEQDLKGTVKMDERPGGAVDFNAHGAFLEAGSEGGLEFGGGSTGFVNWKAHN